MTDDEGIPTSAPDVVEGHEVHEPAAVDVDTPEAVEAVEAVEAAEPEAPVQAKPRRGLVALCVLFGLAAFGFAVIAAIATQRLDEETGERDEVARVAGNFGETFLTYNYEDLDDFKQRVLALSTGMFRDDFDRTFDAALRSLLTETRGVGEGETKEVLVGQIDDESHTVTAIVVVNAASSGTARRRILADSYIRLQLVKVGGEWKVDGVTNLNLAAPTSDLPLPPSPTTTAPK